MSPAAKIAWPESVGPQWSGIGKDSLQSFFATALEDRGDGDVVVFDDGAAFDARTLLDYSERLAAALSEEIGVGDRVALCIGNRLEFLIAWLAILANRGVVVSLDPTIKSEDASHVLADSGAVLAIAEAEAAESLAKAWRSQDVSLRAIWRVEGEEPDGLVAFHRDGRRMRLADTAADTDDLTGIHYTSGTTGLPKALPEKHSELLRFADVCLRTFPIGPGDRFLCPLRFHYGDSLWLLAVSLTIAQPLIQMRRFSVSRFWSVARDFGATRIMTVGSIPNLLLTSPPSAADRDHPVGLAMAWAIPKEQHAELERRFGFPWLEHYGSSEAGPAISMPFDLREKYVGSGALGIPVPEVEARLVDEDGRVLVGAAEGELELAGAIDFFGYLDVRATAEVVHDGWFRTGDLMSRDADGVYYFQGRRKEMIRRGGENLSPAEVEGVLKLHPEVIDAAVVPVADPIRGEEVKAYVQVAREAEPEAADLADFCAARLSAFKVPRYIEFRHEPFPRTPSQRIPKRSLMVDGAHRTETAWDREGAVTRSPSPLPHTETADDG